jgi:hypothetical protein
VAECLHVYDYDDYEDQDVHCVLSSDPDGQLRLRKWLD